ncbi:methionine ABC transporter ATP-binding protein [Mangrovactinospora gilvigrisea]|uniref:Methionine ABC transporter ATP-binding protein n=1 Tax=Mangrovactinospora gilvigrisea TaxID=1428644 RepID=A0A1J7C3M9_9ACTN|nr:ATP-binding cassette domain-containing protein [Mangrovactinospora gilvigrisea]OIV36152.1 methionine ABC transporter ATP-binding protein [Mangrovactinospora gilvigrisea]
MGIIHVSELVKDFRRPKRIKGALGGLRTLVTRESVIKRAVDGIDFTVDEGEFLGYLGPNGAGKSTTIKMMTGILQPTSGKIEVAGIVPWRERQRNALNIGVVFGQKSQLWWDLPLRESLQIIGKLYAIDPARHRANVDWFVELLDLDPFFDTPVRQLSLGQRVRGDLAAAMLPEPRILFLDEPTIGLDVVAKERIRGFLSALNREAGTTVVLTTHDLDDVERLCRRIILIDGGKVTYDGDVESLKSRFVQQRRLVVKLAAGVEWRGVGIPGVAESIGDEAVELAFDPAEIQVSELITAVLADHQLTDVAIVEPELENVVHRIYASAGMA